MIRLALLSLALLAALSPVASAQQRPRWDTRVLALVPSPGFPAHAYVHPNGRIYAGTYDNPKGDTVPSRVFEYTAGGVLQRSWTVRGQDLTQPHGVQAATSDGRGRLVLLDKNPPRVLTLDLVTGEQALRASFPAGSIPNYAAWGTDGSLYVTDYGRPILWRIPPGSGTPEPWLEDARLDGSEFGQTGLALAADRKTLLLAMQSEGGGAAGNPATGRLWAIPIEGAKPGPMRQLWESGPAEGPDGFAIAASGRIYMTLLVANQLVAIEPDGRETERFPREPYSGANGTAVPFDSPSSARFLGTRLIVAQQSFAAGDPTRQALMDVEVGETGLPELLPDELAPVVSAVSIRSRGRALRLTLSEPATVRLRLRRARTITRSLPAGTSSLKLWSLRRGRYSLTLTARDAAGNSSAPLRRTFRRR